MATIDDLNAAIQATAQAVTDLAAAASAHAAAPAPAAEPDYQAEVDALNAVAAQAEQASAALNPPAAE